MLKKIFILISLGLIFNANILSISASDFDLDSTNYIEYNLENGNDIQEYTYINENGENISISIEKVKNMSRSIDNGTYKISTTRTGSWNASFLVTIKDYKITSVGNPTVTAITGLFISKNLKIDSSTMATYYLKRKIGVVIMDKYLRAQIIDKNLRVIVN